MKAESYGLFYHPEGVNASDVLQRMADGTTDYRLDDPFKPAIDEADAEIARLAKKLFDAEHRVNALKNELERARQKRTKQEAAKEVFAETGVIDPILIPSVAPIVQNEVIEEANKVRSDLDFSLPKELEAQGWTQKGHAVVKDQEILITIRKARPDTPETPEAKQERVTSSVVQAMQPFRVDGSHFRRVLRERIATRPQKPKGPPNG